MPRFEVYIALDRKTTALRGTAVSDNITSATRDAWFTEYQTLRQESLQSVGNRNQIITFGLGTVGALAAGTIAALQRPSPPLALVSTMFDIAIPLVSVLVFYAWFAECERMVRAGGFIQRLEQRINETLGNEPVLSWERYLQTTRMRYAYLVVAILGFDHGVGHFRPLSITRQRYVLAYHFIATRHEDLCQVF